MKVLPTASIAASEVTALELHHGDILTLGPRTCRLCQASVCRSTPGTFKPLMVRLRRRGVTALMALYGIESLKFSVCRCLPLSRTGDCSRDGQPSSHTTAHVDMKRLSDFSPICLLSLPRRTAAFTGTLGLTRWHFTSRGGKCAGGGFQKELVQ